jgi:hypothetical protein
MVLQFLRYIFVYVKLYHYLEDVLQKKGLLSQQQIIDPERSQIQCIQRNNAPSKFDCFLYASSCYGTIVILCFFIYWSYDHYTNYLILEMHLFISPLGDILVLFSVSGRLYC